MKAIKAIIVILFLIFAVGRISLFISRNPTIPKPTGSFDQTHEYASIPLNNIFYSIWLRKQDTLIEEVIFPDINTYRATLFSSRTILHTETGSYSIKNEEKGNSPYIQFAPEFDEDSKIARVYVSISDNNLFNFCNSFQSKIHLQTDSSNVEIRVFRDMVLSRLDSLLLLQDESRKSDSCKTLHLPFISKVL